jgi:polyribonucleotide nucleotidyltransferase
MERAMQQAKEARLFILGRMAEAITSPREELSPHAPRITTMKVKPEKIRDIIGPGGRVIRKIVDDTGVKIDVQDDGTVQIASTNKERTDKAIEQIKALTEEAEVGAVYQGVVKKIMDFGAFVEIFPGTDGLLHISQLDHGHPRQVTDILQEGDEVKVKVLAVDENGKIRLSRKALLENKSQDGEEAESGSEEDRGDRDRGEGRPSSRGRGQSRGHGRKDNSRQRR